MSFLDARKADQPITSREEWLKARVALLAKEKQLTRERDELARMRRELLWVSVEKEYVVTNIGRLKAVR